MARKKTTEEIDLEIVNHAEFLNAQVLKEFGENIIVKSDWVEKDDRQVIPVSPAFDVGLSGGIPEGSVGLLSGLEKMGKTTWLMSFAANAQKPENGFRDCYLLKVEGRFERKNLEIEGLNKDKFFIVQSTKDRVLTAEDFLSIAEKIIKDVPKAVVMIDSVSSLSTESEMTSDLSGTQRPGGPKLLAAFCRRVGQIIPIQKTILIGITKKISNVSGYGSPTMDQGGSAVRYAQDWKIDAVKKELVMGPDGKKAIGQKVEWKIVNSALGPPGGLISSHLTFGIGIDRLRELVELACELGVIDRKGAWYYILPDKYFGDQEKKFQGMDKLMKDLRNNKELASDIENEIKGLTYGETIQED